MQHPLHLPLDFELREDVRRLAQKLRMLLNPDPEQAALWVHHYREESRAVAAAFFVRLWCDWGRCGSDWRPLDLPYNGDAHDWEKESIAHIIEDVCEWRGERGGLIKLCIAAGLLILQGRGDLMGFMLNDFWRHNEHLSPDFRSVQSRGGIAKAKKRELAQITDMAGQQREIMKRQEQLTFEDSLKVTPEEEKKTIALIMRIDRACGLPVRSTSEYSADLLAVGVGIIRAYQNDQVVAVEKYLHQNQQNMAVIKIPDRVIADFDGYYKAATHE